MENCADPESRKSPKCNPPFAIFIFAGFLLSNLEILHSRNVNSRICILLEYLLFDYIHIHLFSEVRFCIMHIWPLMVVFQSVPLRNSMTTQDSILLEPSVTRTITTTLKRLHFLFLCFYCLSKDYITFN